eukprot:ctg_2499.g597
MEEVKVGEERTAAEYEKRRRRVDALMRRREQEREARRRERGEELRSGQSVGKSDEMATRRSAAETKGESSAAGPWPWTAFHFRGAAESVTDREKQQDEEVVARAGECRPSATAAAASDTAVRVHNISDIPLYAISREDLLPSRNTVSVESVQRSRVWIPCWLMRLSVCACLHTRVECGPVCTSVYVRDCHDCDLYVARARQVRLHDCRRCRVFVSSQTAPVLEHCYAVQVRAFSGFPGSSTAAEYVGLEEDLRATGMETAPQPASVACVEFGRPLRLHEGLDADADTSHGATTELA